jgi:hypothetical protein
VTVEVDPATGLVPWHVSRLTSLLRCGEADRRRYIERENRPPTTPQLRGSAVHRGIGAGLLEQMRAGTPAPVELMEDVAASEIDRARHGGATFTDAETSVGAARTFGALKDKAVRLAGGYARLVAPSIRPVAVERRISVAGVVPGVLLRGTLDLVDAAAGVEIVRDNKTTERAPRSDAADLSQQLSMYALLRSAETPAPVTRVALDYLVLDDATGAVRHERLDSTRGPRDAAAIVARITAAKRAVDAGVALPASPDTDWFCSEKWCPYWASCPFSYGPARVESPTLISIGERVYRATEATEAIT